MLAQVLALRMSVAMQLAILARLSADLTYIKTLLRSPLLLPLVVGVEALVIERKHRVLSIVSSQACFHLLHLLWSVVVMKLALKLGESGLVYRAIGIGGLVVERLPIVDQSILAIHVLRRALIESFHLIAMLLRQFSIRFMPLRKSLLARERFS